MLIVFFSGFLGVAAGEAKAADLVEVPVNCVCLDRGYKVYGEGDEAKIIKKGSECFVKVSISPVKPDSSPQQEPKFMPESKLEDIPYQLGLVPKSLLSGLQSIFSPLDSLFELSIKKPLKQLSSSVYFSHTRPYHTFIDALFARAISKITSFQKSKDFEDYLVGLQKQSKGKCTNDNPDPRCVIDRAMCSYEKYAGVIFAVSGLPQEESAQKKEDLNALLSMASQRDSALLEEVRQSQEALDTTIMVYSQLFQTYGLHLKFKDVILSLTKVRDLTSTFRSLIACFPGKFTGTATTQCN